MFIGLLPYFMEVERLTQDVTLCIFEPGPFYLFYGGDALLIGF